MGKMTISTATIKAYTNESASGGNNEQRTLLKTNPIKANFKRTDTLPRLPAERLPRPWWYRRMTTTVPSFRPEVAFSPERKRRGSGALLSFRPERSGVETRSEAESPERKSIQTIPHISSFHRPVELLLREVQKDPSTGARGDDGLRSERQAVGRRGGNLWTVMREGDKVVGIPAGVIARCDAAAGVRICAVKDRSYGGKCRANRARGH